MERYYKPELSEFRVGFEYQWQQLYGEDKTWYDAICDDFEGPLVDTGDGGEAPFSYVLSEGGVRVKHLDHDDIISLEWEHDRNECGEELPCMFDIHGLSVG